ncbi:MAG: MFS transporter [Casimicrobiaceae bacterium]
MSPAEPGAPPATSAAHRGSKRALRFVLLIGILSLFADCTYEGSRSVLGPFLLTLQASGAIVGVVTGLGELLGYGLRLVSGRLADVTGRYWPITIAGYVVQMAAVPALALVDNWPAAAALIVLERVGKAIRNPPRDVMLSHAAREMGGYGWAFGLHEALDQIGATVGPLAVAVVLARAGSYELAFGVLALPAAITLLLVLAARVLYPRPHELESEPPNVRPGGLPKLFWIYLAGAALVAAGFADFPIIAFHLTRSGVTTGQAVAVFYAVAMAVSGAGSLVLGRLFDRQGFKVLIALTAIGALFAPLVFLGGFAAALAGAAIWGLGMGVHESIIPAAVAQMVGRERRASAFGIFTGGYGIAWFAGSAAIGVLYDHSLAATVAFCVATQIVAIPVFRWVAKHQR